MLASEVSPEMQRGKRNRGAVYPTFLHVVEVPNYSMLDLFGGC